MSRNISKIIDRSMMDFYIKADKEVIKISLKEEIANYSDYEKKRDALSKKLSFIAKGMANEQKDDRLLEIAEQFISAVNKGLERPVAFLKQMMQNQQTFALNKNLDKLTKEEIMNLIRDKNFVELLELLENGEGNV